MKHQQTCEGPEGSDEKPIKISEEEITELADLSRTAQTTPAIIIGQSATRAWEKVTAKFDELGKKYGFDPSKIKGIDAKTGEVYLYE